MAVPRRVLEQHCAYISKIALINYDREFLGPIFLLRICISMSGVPILHAGRCTFIGQDG